jgi:hypothetical protein
MNVVTHLGIYQKVSHIEHTFNALAQAQPDPPKKTAKTVN